ncbi:MAG: hypothetical protein WA627_15975 [Candidatus Sulfotelmatobacter sp.]
MSFLTRIFARIKQYRETPSLSDCPDAPDVEALERSPLFDDTAIREQIGKQPVKKK